MPIGEAIANIISGMNTAVNNAVTPAASQPLKSCTQAQQNMKAFLEVLKYCETRKTGDAAYWVAFGGGRLTSLKRHPGGSDTPAGAYQIKGSTWNGWKRQVSVPDFSPRSQDIVCMAIIGYCKATKDIQAGNFPGAIAKCAWRVGKYGQWSSLPGSTENKVSMTECRNIYQTFGGQIA